MGDPRNVAHAKKVSQEKHHKDKHPSKAGSVPSQRAKNVQPKRKLHLPLRALLQKPKLQSQLNQQNQRSWRNRL
jgi:hypothetical protein